MAVAVSPFWAKSVKRLRTDFVWLWRKPALLTFWRLLFIYQKLVFRQLEGRDLSRSEIHNNNPMDVATWLLKRNVINHVPTVGSIARYTQILIQRKISRTHVMNKLNKKAILSMRTADICYHLVLCWRKTPVFGITWKTLIISVIVVFNVNKNKNHFQEAAFLEAKSAACCRWNRCFLHQELPFFERKSIPKVQEKAK